MTRFALLLAMIATSGCNDECDGPACGDAGMTDAGMEDTGTIEVDAGPCLPFADINACASTADCPSPSTVGLGVEVVQTIFTNEADRPEIIHFIPGSDDRALVI